MTEVSYLIYRCCLTVSVMTTCPISLSGSLVTAYGIGQGAGAQYLLSNPLKHSISNHLYLNLKTQIKVFMGILWDLNSLNTP